VSFGALLGSELARLRARRAVRIALLIAVALTLLIVVIMTIRSTGTGPADHTLQLRKLWSVVDGRSQDTALLSVAVYLFVVAAGLAATAIGGDYRAGTVGTPLTWEPRRGRLVTARLLAIVVVIGAFYLVVNGVLIGSWWLGAAARGSTAVPGGFWTDVASLVARCLVTTVGFALVTAGIVLLTRSTVGGIIVWVGYLVGIEGVLASQVQGLRERLLLVNLAAFLEAVPERVTDGGGGGVSIVHPSDGVVTLVLFVAVAVALGVVAFTRRDVT